MDYKVYITLGFHINFYHSWRGDTPDEAGFGTDIRVIRQALKILDGAHSAGQQARAYWDAEVYWTFQEILPKHSPDILEGIRRRVQAGLDEIVLGPYNNGANHAATSDEFRAALGWAIENPWGSGLRQLFGQVAPFYRSQETMVTVGQEAIFQEYGVQGLILYYAGVPFNTLGAFIPALSLEQRYNPLWIRLRPQGLPLLLLPCISAADLIEQVSLENLMLDLHNRQRRGEINSDVLIHLNEDADLETWLPVRAPKALAWFPNTGGLEEYIHVVNKYPWAEFTVPSEYVANHPPRGEVLVHQDLADGAFDGSYSWAEKSSSLHLWTLLERSRLASCRAEALAAKTGLDLRQVLWEGMESSFFQRLIGLTTTHFGMSTPVINEERQARAVAILGGAARIAEEAERSAARARKEQVRGVMPPGDAALYDFEVSLTPPARQLPPVAARAAIRLPLVLPAGVGALKVEDETGQPVRASLTEVGALDGGRRCAEMRFVTALEPGIPRRFRIYPAAAPGVPAAPLRRLKNEWLEVLFSEQSGIESFLFAGREIGGPGFLVPFVTYGDKKKPRRFVAEGYTFDPLANEVWDGLQRVRLKTRLPMRIPAGEYASEMTYTFTLFDHLPYLFVDVEAAYAYTPPREIIHNMTQKLRRLMDLGWVEVAPCQLTPLLHAPPEKPLRVWKHNYLGITSFYDLDYGQINPRNQELDSFNHQVTAGWVAVSDGQRGLLVGEDAQTLASMAFCPMRLRLQEGRQSLALNPFGSYYGRQLDHSHLGGNGIGKAFLQAFSGALNPNGPSFNGQTLRFSLLLAPYAGDAPPQALQAEAAAHFYAPGIVLHATPAGLEADTPEDIRQWIAAEQRHRQMQAQLTAGMPLPPPTAFLVNPSPGAVDLVWDAPRAALVTGYEICWRSTGETACNQVQIDPLMRWQIAGLEDGKPLAFKIRAVCAERLSEWTPEQVCTPGAVTDSSVSSMLSKVPLGALLRMVLASLGAVIRAGFQRD